MEAVIDPDVKAVAEFMQSNIEARKLVGVAESLRAIAPILWGRYNQTPVAGIELLAESVSPGLCESRSVANELAPVCLHVDDDSAVVAVGS